MRMTLVTIVLLQTALLAVQFWYNRPRCHSALSAVQFCNNLPRHQYDSNVSVGSEYCPIFTTFRKEVWSVDTKSRLAEHSAVVSSCVLRKLGGDQENRFAGWTICETKELLDSRSKPAIIYSFGLGIDTSFDEAVIAKYGAVVHGFDPTPKSIQYVRSRGSQLPSCFFALHPFGIDAEDGEIQLYPPENPDHVSHTKIARVGAVPVQATVLKLSTIMQMLAHDHVHVLKFDVEGAEYSILASLLQLTPPSGPEEGPRRLQTTPSTRQNIALPFDQLCVEFHPKNHPDGEAAGHAARKEISAAMDFHGFKLVHDTGIQEITFARYTSIGIPPKTFGSDFA